MDARTYTRLEDHLVAVSRSFALSIQALDQPLRERICLAYLVCRVLDTIEDYAEIPVRRRIELLEASADGLFDPDRRPALLAAIREAFVGVPVTPGEQALIDDCELVFEGYDAFPAAVQQRMQPNFREMALGMARYVASEPTRGVEGFDALGELVHYCHFVAGVVGTLLTDTFIHAMEETSDPLPIDLQGELHSFADSFGIGLQLVNVLKNVGDDARRSVSFVPHVLLERAGAGLNRLIDEPASPQSRRFVLDLTSIGARFLERAVSYTNAVPVEHRGIRHFLILPVVFALRTLRLGVAHPAWAFHEQKLKISRDEVRALQSEVEAALDDHDATAALLEREMQLVRGDLIEAERDAPPPATADGAQPSVPARRAGDERDLSQVINLFLLTFEDPLDWRRTVEAARTPALATVPADAGTSLAKGVDWLLANRVHEHWSGLVEASPALNAQAVFLGRALGIFDDATLRGLGDYLRHTQSADGSWPIFAGGDGHFDTTVFCHIGLRALAQEADHERLTRSRRWIRDAAREKQPGFELRFMLAILGLWPWDDLPAVDPVVTLPGANAAFSRYDFAYWIRIALVPMTVLASRRYRLEVPGLSPAVLRELGLVVEPREPREQEKFNRWSDLVSRMSERIALRRSDLERIAVRHAERWILTHQDADGSWGGIYPGIQYSLLALLELGHAPDSSAVAGAVRALKQYQGSLPGAGLVMQSCQSPVWDTAWALFAVQHAGIDTAATPWRDAVDWLVDRQILIEGDWSARARNGFGGGWAFQYENAFYPDVDDTALVVAVLANTLGPDALDTASSGRNGNGSAAWAGRDEAASALRIGLRWLLAMQNDDGGWSAFERGVDNELMREIPMNDLDNWLDPSTADVTGRCLMALGALGFDCETPAVRAALRFLLKDQARSGAWWGRWGVNYIYGTWSVLLGLRAVGLPAADPMIQKATRWLLRCQNPDGGWGETCDSYVDKTCAGQGDSTPSQTAWAVHALAAAGHADGPGSDAVARGLDWLRRHQTDDGTWDEAAFTGTGFPGAFYLRYHLYRHVFPVLALAAAR